MLKLKLKPPPHRIFLLDDIITTAGTMHEAIRICLEHGAKEFYIIATHGEFMEGAVARLEHPAIKEICITDTNPVIDEMKGLSNLKIMSIDDLLAEAILCIHSYQSISAILGRYG